MNIELKRRPLKESMKYLVDKYDAGEIDAQALSHLIRCRLENEVDVPNYSKSHKVEEFYPDNEPS